MKVLRGIAALVILISALIWPVGPAAANPDDYAHCVREGGTHSWNSTVTKDDEEETTWTMPSIMCVDGEGDDGDTKLVVITIDLSEIFPTTETVQYTTLAGTATPGNDYRDTSGIVTVQAGQTVGHATVRVRFDHLAGPEYFFVRIFNPSAGTVTGPPARVTLFP